MLATEWRTARTFFAPVAAGTVMCRVCDATIGDARIALDAHLRSHVRAGSLERRTRPETLGDITEYRASEQD